MVKRVLLLAVLMTLATYVMAQYPSMEDFETGPGWLPQSTAVISTNVSHSPTHSVYMGADNAGMLYSSAEIYLPSTISMWIYRVGTGGNGFYYLDYSPDGNAPWIQIGGRYNINHTGGTWGYYTNTLPDMEGTGFGYIRIRVSSNSTGHPPVPRNTFYIDDIEYVNDDPLPVELTSFSVKISVTNHVELLWITQTETGVLGYYVYRNTVDDFGTAWLVSPLISATNTSQQQSYIYTDKEVSETGMYYYWLQSVDFDGRDNLFGPISILVDLTNSGGVSGQLIRTGFNNIYPNPFGSSTMISYAVAKIGSDVRMNVYNARGRLVRELVSGTQGSSNYMVGWDGKDSAGKNCSNGIYFVVLQSGSESYVRKTILVK